MSPCRDTYRRCASFALVLALVLIALPSLLNAQTAPNAPTVQSSDDFPKAELFIGYQWLNPGGNIPDHTPPPTGPLAFKLPSIAQGVGTSLAYNFTRNLALEGTWGGDWNRDASISTTAIGPKYTWRGENVNFFVHTLLGFERLSTRGVPSSNGMAAILGGGMDIKLWKPITLRLFEADFQWAHQDFSSVAPVIDSQLRRPSYDGTLLRTGLVFNFGGAPEVPVAAACSIDHNEVLVGEPLHATVAASNFNPKHPLTYTWASSGGKIEGKDTVATIDTTGAAPGTYTATARVVDARKKKNGEASCTSNFTVKPLNPPQISCTADPGTVEIGTPSTVTCTCTSPDNATVTVGGWTSSAGSVAGSGNSATFTTTGASAGPATINATCTDSRGLTASATSTVTVNNPPPPPAPVVDKVLEARLALHSVYFVTDKPSATAPNAGMVKSQEGILVDLAADFKKYLEAKPDAHLTLEGHADVRGSVPYNQALSERRVARVKGFLIEQGVPEANLETKAFGKQHNLTTEEVKSAVEQNPELTTEERARFLRNMQVIKWASNRRVDVTLNATGQAETTSVRQYPFNAADSLTLIGGREADRKAAAAKRAAAAPKAPAAKKGAKKPTKKQ
jgi:outer membrane protein OmpA-like peptidoglycan-associated protein